MNRKRIKFMGDADLFQYTYSLYDEVSTAEVTDFDKETSVDVFNLLFCLMELKCRGLSEQSSLVAGVEAFCLKYIERIYAEQNEKCEESVDFTELADISERLIPETLAGKVHIKDSMDYATKLHFIPQIFHESKKDKMKYSNLPKSSVKFMKEEHNLLKKHISEREINKLSKLPVLFKETELTHSFSKKTGMIGWLKGIKDRRADAKARFRVGFELEPLLLSEVPAIGISATLLGFFFFHLFVVELCIDSCIWGIVPVTMFASLCTLFENCNITRVVRVIKFLKSESYRTKILQRDEKVVTRFMLLGWVIQTNFRGRYLKEYGVRLEEDFLDTASDFVKEKFRIYAADLNNYIDIATHEVKLRDMQSLISGADEDLRMRISDLSMLYWGRLHSIDTFLNWDNNAERIYSGYKSCPEVLEMVTQLMYYDRGVDLSVFKERCGGSSVLKTAVSLMNLDDSCSNISVAANEYFKESSCSNRELKLVLLYLLKEKLNGLHEFIKGLWGSVFTLDGIYEHLEELLTYYKHGVTATTYIDQHYKIYEELTSIQNRLLTANVVELVFIVLSIEVLYCKFRDLQSEDMSMVLAVI